MQMFRDARLTRAGVGSCCEHLQHALSIGWPRVYPPRVYPPRLPATRRID